MGILTPRTHRTHRKRRTRQGTTHGKDDADQERREAAQKRHDSPESRKNDSHQRTQASDYRTSDDPEVLIPRDPGFFRFYRRVCGMRGSSLGCYAEYSLDSEIELRSVDKFSRSVNGKLGSILLTGLEQRPNFVRGMMAIIHSAKRLSDLG